MRSGYPRRSSNVLTPLEGKPLSCSSAGLHSCTSISPKSFEKYKAKDPGKIVGTQWVISRIISPPFWYSSTRYLISNRNQRQKVINQQSSILFWLGLLNHWDIVVILPLPNYMIVNNYSASLSPHLFSWKEVYSCLTHPTVFFPPLINRSTEYLHIYAPIFPVQSTCRALTFLTPLLLWTHILVSKNNIAYPSLRTNKWINSDIILL